MKRPRILYVGLLSPLESSHHRMLALQRLGCDVVGVDATPVFYAGNRLARVVRLRLQIGSGVARLNAAILERARSERVDIAWIDRGVLVRPATVRALNAQGVLTVSYNCDNPFGRLRDSRWWLFERALPHYAVHLVPRPSSLDDYRARGARRVMMLTFAYEPTVNYPPPEGWSDADRPHGVTFLGYPWDRRHEFVLELWRRHGIAVHVRGPHWDGLLQGDARAALYGGPPVYGDAYREEIWRSRICLGFVTHANRDTVAHRSFEIAACGTFLLAERTPDHEAAFRPGAEAAFFSDVDECAAEIRRYLDDGPARERIAAAGRRRAVESGYSNDARLGAVLEELVEGWRADGRERRPGAGGASAAVSRRTYMPSRSGTGS